MLDSGHLYGTAQDHAGTSGLLSGFGFYSKRGKRPLRGLNEGDDKTLSPPVFLPPVNVSILFLPAEEFPD